VIFERSASPPRKKSSTGEGGSSPSSRRKRGDGALEEKRKDRQHHGGKVEMNLLPKKSAIHEGRETSFYNGYRGGNSREKEWEKREGEEKRPRLSERKGEGENRH